MVHPNLETCTSTLDWFFQNENGFTINVHRACFDAANRPAGFLIAINGQPDGVSILLPFGCAGCQRDRCQLVTVFGKRGCQFEFTQDEIAIWCETGPVFRKPGIRQRFQSDSCDGLDGQFGDNRINVLGRDVAVATDDQRVLV